MKNNSCTKIKYIHLYKKTQFKKELQITVHSFTPLQTILSFNNPKEGDFTKHCGKDKMQVTNILCVLNKLKTFADKKSKD